MESAVRAKWEAAGQGHVFKFMSELDESAKQRFLEQLELIDVAAVSATHAKCKASLSLQREMQIKPLTTITPLPSDPTLQAGWYSTGLKAISQGKVAVVLLAGGQGTRLGTTAPKGCYDIGLPSHKSLFQIQADRLLRLLNLSGAPVGTLVWYIMTSPKTREETVAFFRKNNWLGLSESCVKFFDQAEMPCITPEGKVILEAKGAIATSPDGNGGFYAALEKSGMLDDMLHRGVDWVFTYSVDNVLVRIADPVFLGFCIEKNTDCALKVIEKAPLEAVGTLVDNGGKVEIVEYSEIDPKLATAVDPATGKLLLNAGNPCIHMFSTKFLKHFAAELLKNLPYHVAVKKIPCADETGKTVAPSAPNGWKLEQFIFDSFPFSKNFVALLVNREGEFSPVKNKTGVDSPDSARVAVFALHKKFITEAGGVVVDPAQGEAQCEISGLLTYAGEGLESLVKGKTLTCPVYLH